MTANEATLIAGLVGCGVGSLTTILTTRYIVKHGPDYEAQIAAVNATLDGRIAEVSNSLNARFVDVNETLGQLTKAHTEHFAQQSSFQQAEVERQKARQWKPDASIQVQTDREGIKNELILKSNEEFTLISVYIQTKTGATLAEINAITGQVSKGYRIPISHGNILKVKQSENKGGMALNAEGRMAYKVSRLGQTYEGYIPFTTEDLIVNSTVWIKLLG